MGIDRSQHFAALIAIASNAKVIMDAAARIEPLALKARRPFLDFGIVVLYDASIIIRITQPPAQPHAPGTFQH